MSVANKLLQAAAGNAGEAVYVDDLFSTNLWDGNGSARNITNGVDLSGEGGLVWIKTREQGNNNVWYDTVRGSGKQLTSNNTNVETTRTDTLTTFNNNGYALGADATYGTVNYNGNGGYVGWTFRKQEKFFDIVTYTGNGIAGRTISHNLGSVPGMMIVKSRSNAEAWEVYHRKADATAPEDKYLQLNGTGGAGDSSFRWNDTAPTATEFTVGGANEVNGNGMTYVAYLFAHNEQDFGENSDEAIIHCDSFTNDESSVGVEVNVGFEPQWLLIKGASNDSLGAWLIIDNMRNAYLKTNNANAESANDAFEFTSKGFKPLTWYDGTLIYVAIARPNKPASEFAANKLFSMDGAGNASGDPDWVSNDHVVDWAFLKLINGSEGAYATARPTGSTYISLTGGDKEYADSTLDKDFQSGFGDSASSAVANYQAWMFRRAKGFFDVVAYAGDNTTNQQVAHNLGVAPELMILKLRNYASGWPVYTAATSAAGFTLLNNTAAYQTGTYWGTSGGTAPTATNVTVDGSGNNSGVNYILLLFASVAGISKVGSYTGTGSDLNVDCGFSAGARFILIKRTDSTGDWYVYDSVRGIVAGNDPYFLLNSTAAQVTNTDYIDPLSSGFTVTSSAPAGLNASSGTYIFLAIA